MGPFPNWPYTNYHELNLDWYLRETIRIGKELKELEARVDQKLEDTINEVLKLIDEFNKTLDQIKAELAKALDDIEEAQKEQARQFEQFIKDQQAELDKFREQFETFQRQIDENYYLIKAYVDSEIKRLEAEIHKPIEGPVFNVFRQKQTTITLALEDYYNFLRDHAYTAIWWDGHGLTCGQFDSLGKTALQWDLNGQHYVLNYTKMWPWFMFSPWTGLREPNSKIIEQLWQYHGMGLTTGVWDDMDYTAGEFDNAQYTAYALDWTNAPLALDKTP